MRGVDQIEFNRFLIQELHKLRQEYQTLKNEAIRLKIENDSLKMMHENNTSSHRYNNNDKVAQIPSQDQTSPNPSYAVEKLILYPPIIQSSIPTIIYDLSYSPPIILNANNCFCNFIGSPLVKYFFKKFRIHYFLVIKILINYFTK